MAQAEYIHPPINPETKPFWDATKQGKFLITRCPDTGKHIWWPRRVSPFTVQADGAVGVPASRLAALSVVPRGAASTVSAATTAVADIGASLRNSRSGMVSSTWRSATIAWFREP